MELRQWKAEIAEFFLVMACLLRKEFFFVDHAQSLAYGRLKGPW